MVLKKWFSLGFHSQRRCLPFTHIGPWQSLPIVACAWLACQCVKALPRISQDVRVILVLGLLTLFGQILYPLKRWGWAPPRTPWGLTLCGLYTGASLWVALGAQDPLHAPWGPIPWDSIVLTVVLVPIVEEGFFRGALRARLPQNIWGIYGSALLFWAFHAPTNGELWLNALAHGAVPIPLGPFLLGLLCAWLAIREGSLWAAILLHALCNGLGPYWVHWLPPWLEGVFVY